MRQGEAVEIALDVDDREDELRRQIGLAGLGVGQLEDLDTLLRFRKLTLQQHRHVREQDGRFEPVLEAARVGGGRGQACA